MKRSERRGLGRRKKARARFVVVVPFIEAGVDEAVSIIFLLCAPSQTAEPVGPLARQ
jgi:hypothetical protein